MSEAIRERFRQRERKLNRLYDDQRHDLGEVRRIRQKQAEDDYLAALKGLDAQHEQEIEELDRIMEKEIREEQDAKK